jgi:hypothetical protein
MPVIITTWKAEVRLTVVQNQPGQMQEKLYLKNKSKQKLKHESSDRVLVIKVNL